MKTRVVRWGALVGVAVVLLGAFSAAILSRPVREPLSAVLAIVVATAAAAYAWTTEKLLEAEIRPNVILSTEVYRNALLYLIVENAGVGEAFEVRVEITKGDFTNFPKEKVSTARFLTDGFSYLAPRQRHAFLLASTTSELKDEAFVELTISYRSRDRKKYVASFPFRLQELLGVGLIEDHTPLGRIAKSLESIQKKVAGDSTT